MDLVYVVGQDFINDNNELRFSLRSAEQHLDFDKVIIVGYKPLFLNDNVIYKKIHDNLGHKNFNVARKIKSLLEYGEVSDDFIFMNDDFFLLKDYSAIPYYYNKSIQEWVDCCASKKSIYYKNVLRLAADDFPDGKFFEVHCPIVYNKKLVKDVIQKYELKLTLMLRSYYCNEYKDLIGPIEETKDYKIYNLSQLDEYKNSPFISTNNVVASNPIFKSFIMTRFPNKSRYEK